MRTRTASRLDTTTHARSSRKRARFTVGETTRADSSVMAPRRREARPSPLRGDVLRGECLTSPRGPSHFIAATETGFEGTEAHVLARGVRAHAAHAWARLAVEQSAFDCA